MRTLVIDTALGLCTAAVCEADQVVGIRSETMARGHAEKLAGFVRDAVEQSAGGFGSVERIGVTRGPGSFTGVRVGIACALGLGQSLGRPVIGIPTLQALVWSLQGGPSGHTLALIDARRGEVYVQKYLDGLPFDEPRATTVDVAREILTNGDHSWRLVGSGASLLTPLSPASLTEADPLALAALTERLDPALNLARPLYLRAPDAKLPTRSPGEARKT